MIPVPTFTRLVLALLMTLGLACPLMAQKAEFRGAWVATVHNIDWPSKAGLSAEAQKAEFIQLLNVASKLKLNAILLQVRPESDALYQSDKEPWSRFLTGKQGQNPGYDPLAFAIKEAHARGIEVHAWFNPFRAATHYSTVLAPNHVAKQHPEWICRFDNGLWLNPGEPAVRDYVLSVMLDVVRRYPIDGIHIDDYFYPYPKGKLTFPDQKAYKRYGGQLSLGDWRRQNINQFVETMYRRVKAARPSLLVGISPFGIWRPGVPMTIEAGVDSYAHLYADSRKWLAEGWCDYLAPQLYWSIAPAKQSFPVLLEWWQSQSPGRAIWPGIATERVGSNRPAQEMVKQVNLTRSISGARPGHIHWSMKALLKNQGGVAEELRKTSYTQAAQVPR